MIEYAAWYPFIYETWQPIFAFVLRTQLTCTKRNEVMVSISMATSYS
jgi:hypothetical protein